MPVSWSSTILIYSYSNNMVYFILLTYIIIAYLQSDLIATLSNLKMQYLSHYLGRSTRSQLSQLIIKNSIFPDPWLVPKAQKSQGQGLANEVFFVHGSFATVGVRVCVRACLWYT